MIDAARARHTGVRRPTRMDLLWRLSDADHVWTCQEIAALLDWCRMAR